MHLDDSIEIPPNKPYGLTINMGGDDVSVVAIVYRKNWDCVNSDRVQQIKIDIYLKTISCFSKKYLSPINHFLSTKQFLRLM
jgi:hypothetical protein